MKSFFPYLYTILHLGPTKKRLTFFVPCHQKGNKKDLGEYSTKELENQKLYIIFELMASMCHPSSDLMVTQWLTMSQRYSLILLKLRIN